MASKKTLDREIKNLEKKINELNVSDEKAGDEVEKLKHDVDKLIGKADDKEKDALRQLKSQVQSKVDAAKQGMKHKEKLFGKHEAEGEPKEMAHKGKEKVKAGKESVESGIDTTAHKGKEKMQAGKESLEGGVDTMAHKGKETVEQGSEAVQRGIDSAASGAEATKEKVGAATQKTQDVISDLGHKTYETLEHAPEKTREALLTIKTMTQQKLQEARRRVEQGVEGVKETIRSGWEALTGPDEDVAKQVEIELGKEQDQDRMKILRETVKGDVDEVAPEQKERLNEVKTIVRELLESGKHTDKIAFEIRGDKVEVTEGGKVISRDTLTPKKHGIKYDEGVVAKIAERITQLLDADNPVSMSLSKQA